MQILRGSTRLMNEVPSVSRASKAPAVDAARGQNFLEAYSGVRSASTDDVPFQCGWLLRSSPPGRLPSAGGHFPFLGIEKPPGSLVEVD